MQQSMQPKPTANEIKTVDLNRRPALKDYLDPIQNNCHYGYVLPDRCRYWKHKGCPCGAYSPIKEVSDG